MLRMTTRKNQPEPTDVSAIDSDLPQSSARAAMAQRMLLLRAYWKLIQLDRCLQKGDFAKLRDEVRTYPCAPVPAEHDALERVCRAIDTACVWYWKEVLCLQRSAATACLLKTAGIPAQMIIGVQQMPFLSHAWVEVNGRVVNDKPYMRDLYMVLDIC
jgi:Transglutaminase-like superfamily